MEFIAVIALYGALAHFVSYYLEKTRILNERRWDLNICCGKTDGGGVNADIFRHANLPRFRMIDDIYNLPFDDREFETVLCSHTLEHVEDPDRFFKELGRVGREVTVVVPPLYDIFAVLNIFEHRIIFLTFRKKHNSLPKYIKLPLAEILQKRMGQINHA